MNQISGDCDVLCLFVLACLLFVHLQIIRIARTRTCTCFGGENPGTAACTLVLLFSFITDVTMAGSAAVIFYSVEDIWPIILREL